MSDIKRIEYTSEKGFKGVLINGKDLTIITPDGEAVLHSTNSVISDPEQLKTFVDRAQNVLETLTCK